MHETYYTSEQLAQLEARREEVGEDQIAAIERDSTPNPLEYLTRALQAAS
ncbi:MAG: hypothetical protein ABI595_14540 [Actinomycetota bacterium]